MAVREGKPDLVPKPLSQAANRPPYPTTPSSEFHPDLPPPGLSTATPYQPNTSSSGPSNVATYDVARQLRRNSDLSYDSASDWEDDSDDDFVHEPPSLPAALRVGGSRPDTAHSNNKDNIPAVLRVGPPEGALRRSQDAQRPITPQQQQPPQPLPQTQPQPVDRMAVSTNPTGASDSAEKLAVQSSNPNNPYLRMQHTGSTSPGKISTASITAEPVELPSHQTPIDKTPPPFPSTFSPSDTQPALIPVESENPRHKVQRADSTASSAYEVGMDISSLDAFTSRSHGMPTVEEDAPQHRTWQEQQAWEQESRLKKERDLVRAHEAALLAEQERKAEEEWYRGEAARANGESHDTEFPPSLPPRHNTQPTVDVSGAGSFGQGLESPRSRDKRQRKEFYQIKNIRWYDAQKQGIRVSPILIQNLNGPCPLLALVNALLLSTPAGEETALVETLRTREQVSLGLLLDAVFDELMSGRRGEAAQGLPDVGDLYSFLVTLHTGMNVNPRFTQATDAVSDQNSRQGQTNAGGFEDTKEMKLYSTFNVPLIHGWLPPDESRAHIAFSRVAPTYDAAQTAQFQEEELESKLRAQGLQDDEQRLFEDLHSIKEFLTLWPTQLTNHGLSVIARDIKPGQFAILFRNDHFSTLYNEPRSGRIMTLVTDAGYASHDEIVWESLVDVNGQGSELFSGDFRPVGNMAEPTGHRSQEPAIRSLLDVDDNQGWTTVPGRRSNHRQQGSNSSNHLQAPSLTGVPGNESAGTATPSTQSKTEQEDHDLALALQLQEEEEDRHRREVSARRRQENELSQSYLQQHRQQDEVAPTPPPRPQTQEVRPPIPPRHNRPSTQQQGNTSEDLPPPTYEQASHTQPYHPPLGHPSSPNTSMRPHSMHQQPSTYNASSGHYPPPGGGSTQALPIRHNHGRTSSGGHMMGPSSIQRPGQRPGGRDEEKCIVM